ncbi:MAG: glycine cleavage system protein H [Candidatus Heimdallarchaeota archaeon]|nr:glycine cleavage system protein H [Candidatus Heimdallarchaeota archaeon]MDH5647292.1 glycine cleavage system protein H [Candidatus Heimdallarchaeota archaeon]
MTEIKVADYIVKTDRMYLPSHEWVKDNGDGTFSMGISDYAQKMLREISYVQFEDVGEDFESKDVIAVVEALKATGDIYAPFKCKIIDTNMELEDNPELVTESPYETGYLLKIQALEDDRSNLITAQAYASIIEDELADL